MKNLLWVRSRTTASTKHLLALGLLGLATAGGASAQVHDSISQPGYKWVGTWGASPSASPQGSTPVFSNDTVRMIAHVSLGTNSLVRVRLSNASGAGPIVFSDVHFAQWAGNASNEVSNTVPGTDQAMTFNGGASSVNVPAGTEVVSDWIYFPTLKTGIDVAVSVFIPTTTTQSTLHYGAQSATYFAPGDVSGSTVLPNSYTYISRPYLTGVEVAAQPTSSAIVTLGDSITDGAYTTNDGDVRWPDDLGVRLQAQYGNQLGIVNAGIGANQLLADLNPNTGIYDSLGGIHRLNRDVLSVPGIKYLILFEGINDIGTAGATAAQIIEGYHIVIARAHELGIYVYGGTLTPIGGSAYYTATNEQTRQTINAFIRTSGVYDGVIDFDKAIADPSNPVNILASYNSDGLHPNNAGYQAMANAVGLSLFNPATHP